MAYTPINMINKMYRHDTSGEKRIVDSIFWIYILTIKCDIFENIYLYPDENLYDLFCIDRSYHVLLPWLQVATISQKPPLGD